jgi:hypothetical protein
MAHMTITANKADISIAVDAADWESFSVNGNPLPQPGQGGGTGSVTFAAKCYGPPTSPFAAMGFVSGSGATAQFWLAVITFQADVFNKYTLLNGTVVYGNASNQNAIAAALAAVPTPYALQLQPPTAQQGFSASHLMGSFAVTP